MGFADRALRLGDIDREQFPGRQGPIIYVQERNRYSLPGVVGVARIIAASSSMTASLP